MTLPTPNAATLALLSKYAPESVQSYQRASDLLARHLRPEAIANLNENMHGAVVSFCLDMGFPLFGQSTLRHRINAGRLLEAVAEFLPHHTRDGRTDRVRKERRHAEAWLFCSFKPHA